MFQSDWGKRVGVGGQTTASVGLIPTAVVLHPAGWQTATSADHPREHDTGRQPETQHRGVAQGETADGKSRTGKWNRTWDCSKLTN